MARKGFTPEQIVAKLRQIEVQLSQGRSIALACRDAEISEQSYYRWRKEYGGLQLEQAKRLKELERENSRLRRLVADLSLEKQVLKDVAQGNSFSIRGAWRNSSFAAPALGGEGLKGPAELLLLSGVGALAAAM